METSARRLWARRLGWLIALWAAGVGALAVFATLLKLFMRAAGLTS